MLKEKARLLSLGVYIAEMTLVFVSFFLSFKIREKYFPSFYGPLFPITRNFWLLGYIIPVLSILFYYFGLYESQRTKPYWVEVWKISKACFWGTMFLMAVVFVSKAEYISRLFIIIFGMTSLFSLLLERFVLRVFIRAVRRKGYIPK
jgi:FlaA1/EpsC-like NDP-sugar epimerase